LNKIVGGGSCIRKAVSALAARFRQVYKSPVPGKAPFASSFTFLVFCSLRPKASEEVQAGEKTPAL
jgi:hypothetical protein